MRNDIVFLEGFPFLFPISFIGSNNFNDSVVCVILAKQMGRYRELRFDADLKEKSLLKLISFFSIGNIQFKKEGFLYKDKKSYMKKVVSQLEPMP